MSGQLSLKFFYGLELQGQKYVIDWCISQGLIASKYECPRCKSEMKLVARPDVDDGFNWMCRKGGEGAHYVKRTVRKGSWFAESRLSITDALCFAFLWVYRSSTELYQTELNVRSVTTLVEWRQFCREVCVDMCVVEKEMIGGVGVTIELNESMFGKRKCNRGKWVTGEWVFGGVERGTNRCFFIVVEKRSLDMLLDTICKNVLPGSTIVSSCWEAYGGLSAEEFDHYTVNYSLHFENFETGQHTFESLWSNIKQEFRRQAYRHVDYEKLLDPYFAEYMWRRRHMNEDLQNLFPTFLKAIKTIFPQQTMDE